MRQFAYTVGDELVAFNPSYSNVGSWVWGRYVVNIYMSCRRSGELLSVESKLRPLPICYDKKLVRGSVKEGAPIRIKGMPISKCCLKSLRVGYAKTKVDCFSPKIPSSGRG